MMLGYEGLDLGQNRMMCHGHGLSRVITRTSTDDAGFYTKLRDSTRSGIPWPMGNALVLDIERLKADMAERVERTSARSFSLKVTGGKNPDFYRNFVNNGQDKRLSADVFMGIVNALDRNAADYMIGMERRPELPSATVLTSAFAVLLDSLGIPPFEDERAQKLAARFPDALQSVADLHAKTHTGTSERHGEDAPAPDEESAPR